MPTDEEWIDVEDARVVFDKGLPDALSSPGDLVEAQKKRANQSAKIILHSDQISPPDHGWN